MSPNRWEECFLLHQRSYGETSIIAEVFTRNLGKMSIIARGAKKPKSKFFGYLVPFSRLKITFSGRSELKTLTNIDRDLSLTNTYLSRKSYSLLYINELMIKLLPKDAEHKPLFDLYSKFIQDSVNEEKMDYLLRNFELDLLEMLGYGINFHADINNEEEIKLNKNYIFVAESGFMASDNAKDFSGEDIIKIRERNFADISTKKLKQLTQATIMFCLEGKDLNSRQIFRRLEK
ncbi:MAG: DNA repair protein RecO [Gammaproteobacteria bacterium TMED186]|nr:MAG: DNA repair protein RecO [Gammaproteobacteria bacterium TMED186]|tara:strand:+ start:4678 stop:5376 length:699 start_codon:yes stop_codon:yes gene_type:complete